MADISISKSRGKKYLGGSSPMVPAFIVGDDPIPLNPPGSNTSHSPVTIGSPANGLSLSGQVLSLNPNDIGAVLITGTQTITGAKTFDNSLLVLSGTSPVFRIASNGNVSTLNFRANSNEEKATLQYSDATNAFSIATRVNNSDISITPHGTGKIKLSNVPSGTGDVLMRDASNNLVRGSGSSLKWVQTTQKYTGTGNNILAADIGSLTFTPSEMIAGKIYKFEVFHGASDFLYGSSTYNLKLNSTVLSDSGWQFNAPMCHAYGLLTFQAGGDIAIGIFAQGISGGLPKIYSSSLSFYSIDTSINQDFSINLTGSYDGEYTFYSKCEILN
jgi:hypothetical protein